MANRNELIIKDTHRGLRYEDGVLVRTLEAGRHVVSRRFKLPFRRYPKVEIVLVDMRERDLTIKGYGETNSNSHNRSLHRAASMAHIVRSCFRFSISITMKAPATRCTPHQT